MVADTPGATATTGAVSVAVPLTVASAVNSTLLAAAFAVSVAVAFAALKMALLPSDHVAFAPPFVQASASSQFVFVPFQM